MAKVADVLARKGTRWVEVAGPHESVLEAIWRMNARKIGALVVTQGGRVVGIFTERDVLRRVVAEERSPRDTRVEEVMSHEVACCRHETELDEIRNVMAHHRIRHLPVCDEDGRLDGIVSIGDLNAWDADGKEETIHWLNEYISGRA